MRTTNHKKNNKIEEALELLNEAAQEKKEEVYEMIGDKYESLRGIFEEVVANGREVAETAQKQLAKGLHYEEKKIRQAAAKFDKKIHSDPWKFLGGIALGTLIVGMVLGRKKSHRRQQEE